MDIVLSLIKTSLELGALYGIAVIGLVISFRLTGFADLTMEGSLTTGAAITAVSIANGVPPVLALFFGAIIGSVTGLLTASLHVKIGVNKLLSGIITMTILYSVNLRIMGRPNYSLLNLPSIFGNFGTGLSKIIFVVAIAVGCVLVLWWILSTDFGFFLRATGENHRVVRKSGVNPNFFILMGLMIANFLIAFAGGMIAQNQGFADIGMGVGIIIATLASLLIGEAVISPHNIPSLLFAALIGATIYQFIIAAGLRIGISPWDLKLATGVLVVFAVVLKKYFRKKETPRNIGCEVL